VPRVVGDAGKLLNHLGDSRQRPQVCSEAMTLRSETQRGIYLGQLLCIEAGFASGAPRSLEFLDAPLEKTGKPSADALTADAK
jgi:hypothetical protein